MIRSSAQKPRRTLRRMRSSSLKLSDFDKKKMAVVSLCTVAFVMICFLWSLPSPKANLQGCETTKIWSHRGHFNAGSLKKSCEYSLNKLSEANIRHFDIDVLLVDGVATVAHPAELSKPLLREFQTSPCSNIPLAKLLHKLEDVYGRNYFFLTIEPKAAWTPDVPKDDTLQDPGLVMTEILNVLEQENIVDPDNCGIIIEQQYYDAYPKVTKRLDQICRQTATPYRYGPNFSTSLNQQVLPKSTHKILMPSIEHFAGFRNTEFLQKSAGDFHVVSWIVDTKEELRNALELPNMAGVISNHPLQMVKYFQELCEAAYNPSFV